MSDEDKKTYLEFAKRLALEAGEIMLRYFLVTERTWKSDNTPLTQADTEINSLVIQRINEAYPDHSILGEEESDMRGGQFVWVCDPVDGTMPYSHGLPISTFSLALCDDGKPQVGVVYDPFTKRLFWAASGSGAYCNQVEMHVNSGSLEHAIVNLEQMPSRKNIVNLSHDFRQKLWDNGATVTSLSSTILPGALIAHGDVTAMVFNFYKPEDSAAIKVIIEEAGGRVTDLFGNDQRYDRPTKGFIASNGVIHDELVKLVKEASK